MKRHHAALLICAALGLGAAPRAAPPPDEAAITASICHELPRAGEVPATLGGWAAGAQLFAGLGAGHRAAGTHDPAAQRYFDEGLAWVWGFNHDEATRAFARAAMIDPRCALCFWGVALAIGPNYNLPLMSGKRGRVAYAAMQRALALAPQASPSAQALIAALAQRYPDASAIGASTYPRLQLAYANAMRDAARRFPADDDIQTLTAEAVMGLNAWKLWSPAGTPAPGTAEVLSRLETVLARAPDHPGANHYYIHAVEESPDPGRAAAAADRLGALMPAAGHIVHMPSHIYQRIGRYADGARVNAQAARADMAYFLRTAPIDYYPGYTAHNWEFEAFSAAELGRRGETLAALRHARALTSDATLIREGADGFGAGRTLFAQVRFGDWAGILATPAPDARLGGLAAVRAWARGMARAATGDVAGARHERAALAALAASVPPGATIGMNSAQAIYGVALSMLDARIAGAGAGPAAAVAGLSQAAAAEDALAYDEPADWPVPVRPMLGQALLAAGRAEAAEAVFREDLRRRPLNAWALQGLAQAIAEQGRYAGRDAEAARRDSAQAWRSADIAVPVPAF